MPTASRHSTRRWTAVIDGAAYAALDELRRFRHWFRRAYGIELDPLRLQLVMTKATALRAIYGEQVDGFVGFLRRWGGEETVLP